jgi:hypothetical protein
VTGVVLDCAFAALCVVVAVETRTFVLQGQEFAGDYSGYTVIPLTTGVSASGIEAQCLLRHAGYSPGTIDGIFGPISQSAAKSLRHSSTTTSTRGSASTACPGRRPGPGCAS